MALEWKSKIDDVKEKVVVPEVKQELKSNVVERAEPVVIVSSQDAYIHERMKSMPKNEEEISMKVSQLQTDNIKNPLELPTGLKKHEKKYSFCWVSKNKRSMDEYLDVLGFLFVNPRLFPDLPKYLFTANGSIERGDLILLFISKEKAEALRLKPVTLSQERVQNTLVQPLDKEWEGRGGSYYKPDSGVSENDKEEVPQGKFIQVD